MADSTITLLVLALLLIVPGLHGSVSDVFGEHGFAQAVGPQQNQIALCLNEFQAQRVFDQGAINLLRPTPIEIGDRAKAPQAGLREQAFEVARGVVGEFARGEFFQQCAWCELLACCTREDVVELFGCRAQVELAQLCRQVSATGR